MINDTISKKETKLSIVTEAEEDINTETSLLNAIYINQKENWMAYDTADEALSTVLVMFKKMFLF